MRLSSEIAALLLAKLVALGVLYFAFFSAPPAHDARAVAVQVLGAP